MNNAKMKANMVMDGLKSKPVLIRSLMWFGMIGLCTALMMGALAQNSSIGLLWFLIAVGSYLGLVVRAYIKDLKDEVRTKFEAATAAEEAAMRKEQEEQKRRADAQSAEVAQIRAALTPDIRACMADTQYSGWFWANRSTTERLYLQDDNRKVEARICLTTDMRVLCLDVQDGPDTVRLENKPYLLMKQAERAETSIPVDQFLDNALPGTTWTWGSVAELTIWVTSQKFGTSPCKAQLHPNKMGGYSSMRVTLPDGTVKQVNRRGGKSTTSPAAKTVAVSPLQTEKPTRLSPPAGASRLDLGTTVLVSEQPEPAAQAPDTSHSVEVPKATLLQPTDEPELTKEQIQQSVEQIRRALSDEYADRAEAAAAEGRNSFVASWPEGVQTQIEAEYLVQAFIDSKVYCQGTVNAQQQTVELFFQQA